MHPVSDMVVSDGILRPKRSVEKDTGWGVAEPQFRFQSSHSSLGERAMCGGELFNHELDIRCCATNAFGWVGFTQADVVVINDGDLLT